MTECREIKLQDGRTLVYAEHGSPRGLPIIHCHGTPSSRVEGELTFSGTTAAELGVRIIVPDRPGMGRSDFQPARRIVDWLNDVLELAAALGLDIFAVLGSSAARRTRPPVGRFPIGRSFEKLLISLWCER